MIPGFTMRVRVINRKALLAWFAGQPGETGIYGDVDKWVMSMCTHANTHRCRFKSVHPHQIDMNKKRKEETP